MQVSILFFVVANSEWFVPILITELKKSRTEVSYDRDPVLNRSAAP